MPSAEELTASLKASELAPERVEISDVSDGCGSKFEAIIVSSKFDGMGLLDRQRAVNALLPMGALRETNRAWDKPFALPKMEAPARAHC